MAKIISIRRIEEPRMPLKSREYIIQYAPSGKRIHGTQKIVFGPDELPSTAVKFIRDATTRYNYNSSIMQRETIFEQEAQR